MPGRGTPWRFGKGVKDRIGTADIKDNEISTDDIKDSTIKLEDLATEVTNAIGDGGYNEVLDEGNSLPKRARLDFKGVGVTATDGEENTTTVTITQATPDGTGYDSISDEGGEILTQRAEINFTGTGVTATDAGGRTVVTIPGSVPDGTGYDRVEDEGTPLTQRSEINFTGAGVTATDDGEKTVVDIPAGSGGYDTIQEEGVGVAQESVIDFQGAGVTATAGTGKTIVTIPGGLGGGGGGGSNDLEQAIVFEEDFFSNDSSSIHNQLYGQLGAGNTEGNAIFPIQIGGVFDTFHDNDVVGTLYGLEHGGTNSDFAKFDFTGSDCIGKFAVGYNALTNMSAWVGFTDGLLANNQNPASIANIESLLNEGAYFRWHSTTSGNWFAVTMNGGTKTETDTGVAVTAGNIIRLKVTYTDATSVTFTIDEVDVATHTTNLPATDLGFIVGGASITQPNTNGDLDNPHGIDYVQIEQARSGATIGVGSGGAGAGGGFPSSVPFDRYMFFEDFYWNDTTGIEEKYVEIGGTGGIGLPSSTKLVGGVIEIQGSGVAGEGQGLGLISTPTSAQGMWLDPTKDTEVKDRASFTGSVSSRIDFIGCMDLEPETVGATSVALAEANFANGAYFRYDGSGNWQAITMNTSTKTTTDTGVTPILDTQQNFEIIFTSTNIVFKIADVVVATHTTNLPTELVFLQNTVISQSATQVTQGIDAWYIIGDR